MSERPGNFDGERRQSDDLAPETRNSEQMDGQSQAQSVTDDAMDRTVSVLGLEESEKLESVFDTANAQDLVDHMRQMDKSGTVDMSAFANEPNHDDNEGKYG